MNGLVRFITASLAVPGLTLPSSISSCKASAAVSGWYLEKNPATSSWSSLFIGDSSHELRKKSRVKRTLSGELFFHPCCKGQCRRIFREDIGISVHFGEVDHVKIELEHSFIGEPDFKRSAWIRCILSIAQDRYGVYRPH